MKCDDEGELMPESNDDIGYINDIIKARKEGAKQAWEEMLKHLELNLKTFGNYSSYGACFEDDIAFIKERLKELEK